MLYRALLLLPIVLTAGCMPGDSDTEKLRDVKVPGYETPALVLYARSDTETCQAFGQRSVEITDRRGEHRPFRNGYYQVRVDSKPSSYRAFFRPERMSGAPHDSAFIFCVKDSTPISANCRVVGTMRDGCFSTAYSLYKLSETESLIKAIRSKHPGWRQQGGT